jgi:hypothetical protein
MHDVTILGTILFLLLVLKLAPSKSDFLGTCESLLQKLPPNQYERLCDFIEEIDYAAMWSESGGLKGVIARLRAATIYVQLIQIHYRDGRISKADARWIWGKVMLMAWFSLRAIPEAVICRIWTGMPRLSARAALGYYCEIVMRVNTLCVSPEAPPCILKLSIL